MFYLLARSQANPDAFSKTFPDENVFHDVMSILDTRHLHEFWTIGFQGTPFLLDAMMNTGTVRITIESARMIVSGNTQDWHNLVKLLLEDDRKSLRQFASTLVTTFGDLFRGLSKTLNPDGTIVLRKL